MKIIYKNKRFELYSNLPEDLIIFQTYGLESHGEFWSTTDVGIALELIDFCEASPQLKRALHRRAELNETHFEIPSGLELRPYQKEGVLWMQERQRGILADDMGLGKSIQIIALNNQRKYRNVLILCPNHLKHNWFRELVRWNTQDISFGISEAGQSFPDTDVVIVNYDMVGMSMKTWKKRNKKKLKSGELTESEVEVSYPKKKRFYDEILKRQWEVIYCDEAHRLRNDSTIASKAVNDFSKKVQNIVFATGSPIINRPMDIYFLLKVIDPKEFGNKKFFAQKFCNLQETFFGWDTSGSSNEAGLKKILSKHMLRRKKADVLKDLPPKIHQTIEISSKGFESVLRKEFGTQQKWLSIFDNLEIQIEQFLASHDYDNYRKALKELNDKQFLAFTELAQARKETALAKVPVVVDHAKLLLESEDKIIIFGHHREVLFSLKKGLEKENPAILVGAMTKSNFNANLAKFKTDPSCRVLLASIKAAGEGLNLTEAAVLVFAELDWTPSAMEQAEDRIWRIGQTKQALIQYLILSDSLDHHWMIKSIDPKLLNKINMKADMIKKILG